MGRKIVSEKVFLSDVKNQDIIFSEITSYDNKIHINYSSFKRETTIHKYIEIDAEKSDLDITLGFDKWNGLYIKDAKRYKR